MITLDRLSREEALRYMGGARAVPDERLNALIDDCEAQILGGARPAFLYKIIALPDERFTEGKDIAAHLEGCDRAVLLCATLGAEIDKLIRVAQVSDMARAVVLDSLASAAVEQLCDKAEREIAERISGAYLTFRFSPGYGDYPIALQKRFLTELDAPRKIGLSANENHILIPSKSVTAIAGISDRPVEQKKRGCAVCSMRETCRYRKGGTHCGF